MKNTFKTIRTLSRNRFLSLYEIEYTNKKGKTKHWMVASRKTEDDLRAYYQRVRPLKSDAVVIYAVHEPSDKLVLIRQHRMPVNDYVYELPAGLIDPGEEAMTSVKRELKEETGLSLLDLTQEPVQLISTPGLSEEAFEMVYCTCTGDLSKEFLEVDEDIEAFLMGPEDLRALLASRPKMDIKAYHGCNHYLSTR